MILVWSLAALAIAGAVISLVTSSRRSQIDHGAVSHRWIAEHRMSQEDSNR